MWKGEDIRKNLIPLSPEVRTKAQANAWLGLDELEDVNKPYWVCAITNTQIPDYPFALLVYIPRDAIREKGWPIAMCPETRVMSIMAHRPNRPFGRGNTIY